MRDRFVEQRLPAADQLPEFQLLDYPARLNAAAELVKGGKGDDLAVVNVHGHWTYADLDDFSGRIARLLVEEESLIPGNRVLLRGPNCYTMFAAWLGILKAGGVVVATMPLLRPGEIATVIDRAEVSHAIVDVPTEGHPVPVNRYVIAREGAQAIVYYWYQGRNRVAADEYGVKWDLLRDAALQSRSEEALVRLVLPISDAQSAEAADTLARAAIRSLVPALVEALPS